jgi:Flp pilus assembly pilin Flp
MRLLNKKAQSTLEYAVVLAVVAGALLAMQIYVKRGIQGRLRSSTDTVGEQYSAGRTTAKFKMSEIDSQSEETIGYTGSLVTDPAATTAPGKGITHSQIITPGQYTKETLAANQEKITANLTEEGILTKTGQLFGD